MKKLIYVLILAIILIACNQEKKENTYTINGTVEGYAEGKAFLQNRVGGEWIKLDSAKVVDGLFMMTSEIDAPEVYYLSLEDQRGFLSIFVEASDILVSGNIEDWGDAEINGSSSQYELDTYMAARAEIDKKSEELYTLYKDAKDAGDEETVKMITAQLEGIGDADKIFVFDYIQSHTSSVMAPYLTRRYAYYFDLDQLIEIKANLDPVLDNSPYVKFMTERIEILKSVAIGQPAPDFTMNDTLGNPVSLSSLKGKYLLVDFWASWCSPCRAENPNVVVNYELYKGKGFDVLGVSFDQNNDKWIEAIYDDGLTWTHVSDLKGWGNAVGKIYGVMSIPANVLLDPDGVIIAKNLSGEALGNELQKIFSEI